MHHGIATAIASDFLNRRRNRKEFPQRGANFAIFLIAKCIATATVSFPQRNRNLFPRKNRCVQFDRVNESQASTANHRRETVHLALKVRCFPGKSLLLGFSSRHLKVLHFLGTKCTTASQPQSLAIFLNRRRNRKEFPQRGANFAIFLIAKCIATATVSFPQRNRNLFPRKNRCVQFDRVNESQASTANHRRETVHLALKVPYFPGKSLLLGFSSRHLKVLHFLGTKCTTASQPQSLAIF